MKTRKVRHKHIKLLKITRQDAERIEVEWFRRYNLLTKPNTCLLYTSPSPRDRTRSRMPSSA